MTIDFRTSVSLVTLSKDESYVVIQAPHAVRERIWKVLDCVYNDGIVSREGGVPTQITLQPFPGYTWDTVVGIAVGAAYIGTYLDGMNYDLIDVWSHEITGHKAVHYVYVDHDDLSDFNQDKVWEAFGYVVNSYIRKAAKVRIEKLLNEAFFGLCYPVKELEAMRDEVIEAYRRLKLYNAQFGFPILRNPDDDVYYFNEAVDTAKWFNNLVIERRQELDQAIKNLALDQIECGDSTVNLYRATIKEINNQKRLTKIDFEKMTMDAIRSNLRIIRNVTPPDVQK